MADSQFYYDRLEGYRIKLSKEFIAYLFYVNEELAFQMLESKDDWELVQE